MCWDICFDLPQETKASENNADDVDAKAVDDTQKTSPESTGVTKIPEQHTAKDIKCSYTSKESIKLISWSSVVIVVIVLVLVLLLANVWGHSIS